LDGDKPNQSFVLDPGESLDVDMWVPWVFSAGDLSKHNIALTLNGVNRWMLWQSNQSDGDYVRMTTDATWSDPAPKVNGTDQVGGDRALVVLDDSIELMSATRRPTPPPGEGDVDVTFTKTSTQFKFAVTESGHPFQKIVSVTNATRDNQDEVRVPLLVNLDTASGSVGQNRINPTDTSSAFEGFPVDGAWTAYAVDVSQVFLRDYVTLSVHWRRDPVGIPDIVGCVRRNDNNITAIGGTDNSGARWTLSEKEAVQAIKNGQNFYVIGVSGKRTRVVVRKIGSAEFLRTMADNDITNNLSALPNCPQ